MNPREELEMLRGTYPQQQQAMTPEREELELLRNKHTLSKSNPIQDSLISATSGATLGFVDEIAGTIAAAGSYLPEWAGGSPALPDYTDSMPQIQEEQSFGNRYEVARDAVRDNQNAYRDEHPVSSFITEMAGAIPTGMIGATKSIPANIARATGEGAVYGAGSSEGETVGDIAKDTALGAGLGLTVGSVLGGGARVADQFKAPKSQDQAKNILYDAMERVPEGFDGAIKQSRQLPPDGALVNALEDVGETLGQGAVGLSPYKSKPLAQSMAKTQDETSSTRIKGYLNKLLGRDTTPDYYGELTGAMKKRSEEAQPYYELAKDNMIKLTPEFKGVLDNPRMQSLIKKSRQYIEDTTGKVIPKEDMLKYGHLNEVIKASNKIIAKDPSYTDLVTKSLTTKGRQAKALKDRLLTHMDAQDASRTYKPDGSVDYPGNYATARQKWGGRSQIIQAMEDGKRTFELSTPSELKTRLKKMNQAEKEAFTDGATETLITKMGRAKSGQMSNYNFLAGENAKEKLEMLLPDKDVDTFFRQLDTERSMRATSNALLSNSQTALRQQATESLQRGVIDSRTVRFMKQNVLANISDVIKESNAQYATQVSEDLAEMLFTTKGPQNIEKILTKINADKGAKKVIRDTLPAILQAIRLPLVEQQ